MLDLTPITSSKFSALTPAASQSVSITVVPCSSHVRLRAALKDGDAEADFNPVNSNDADTLTMKLGMHEMSGRMDDVKLTLLLCDVCDEEFDSIQSVDPQRNTIPVNVEKKAELSAEERFRHGMKRSLLLYIRNTV